MSWIGATAWSRSEPGSERLALDERHREIKDAVDLARLKQGNDVGVLKPRRKLNLQPEPLCLDLGRDFAAQNLDCNATTQLAILGHEHPAHGAAMELALEGVRIAQGRSQGFKQIFQHYLRDIGLRLESSLNTGTA